MKKLIIVAALTTFTMTAHAATKEEVIIQLSKSMLSSLVDAKLQSVCQTEINDFGQIQLRTDDKCINDVNRFRNELAKDESAKEYLDQVDNFMTENSIPRTFKK